MINALLEALLIPHCHKEESNSTRIIKKGLIEELFEAGLDI